MSDNALARIETGPTGSPHHQAGGRHPGQDSMGALCRSWVQHGRLHRASDLLRQLPPRRSQFWLPVLVWAGIIFAFSATPSAHFAEFATLVRRNSPPWFTGFGRLLGGRASGRRRVSVHPLILTPFRLRLSA